MVFRIINHDFLYHKPSSTIMKPSSTGTKNPPDGLVGPTMDHHGSPDGLKVAFRLVSLHLVMGKSQTWLGFFVKNSRTSDFFCFFF